MPSLREEITKTFRRFGRGGDSRPSAASLAETIVSNDPREGKQYGTYRILRRLGVGGMGQVYLAIDTRLGRHAALKFLDNRLISDPAMLLRLYQEARTASSLNHPNILTIYDIGEFDGEHFIATEYVEGITLRAALERNLINPQIAIEIAAQVASALMAAHAAEIVHRDLKASNLMLRPDGILKVIDFGLAKVTAARVETEFGHNPLSSPGTVAGTVEYMSPEQAAGDNIDSRTDLWSLGVVLYEMLYRKFPFDGTTESHVIVAILDHPLPPLPHSSSVPLAATRIIERALTKDRNKRYQSASHMLADLQALGIQPRRISAIRKFAVLPAASRSRVLPLAGGAAALLIALAAWWWPFHGKERVLGPDWFVSGVPEQVTHSGNVELASVSPDGNYLGYVSRDGGEETLSIRNVSSSSESRLSLDNSDAIGLSFSPDSRSLFYVLKDQHKWGRLFSIDVSSSIPKPLLEDIDGPVTFSPDGKNFAFLRRTENKRTSVQSILITPAANIREQKSLLDWPNAQVIRTLAWSPEGDRIAAVRVDAGLHGSLKPHLLLAARDGTQKEAFSSSRFRSMDSPGWLDESYLLFTGATQGRTNQQATLYELSVNTGQIHEIASPPLITDTVSATRDGKLISAVRLHRSLALWLAGSSDLKSPKQIFPDKSSSNLAVADRFSWRGSNAILYPTANPESLNLSEIAFDGRSKHLTSVDGSSNNSPSLYRPRQASSLFRIAAAILICGGSI